MCTTPGKKITGFDISTDQDWQVGFEEDDRPSSQEIRELEHVRAIRKKRGQIMNLSEMIGKEKGYIAKVLHELKGAKRIYEGRLMNPMDRKEGDTAEFLSGALKGIDLAIAIIEGDKNMSEWLTDIDMAEGITQSEEVMRVRNQRT